MLIGSQEPTSQSHLPPAAAKINQSVRDRGIGLRPLWKQSKNNRHHPYPQEEMQDKWRSGASTRESQELYIISRNDYKEES